MMSLFVDTSNFKLIVGVVNEKSNSILTYYEEELKEDLSSKILVIIKKCIEESNLIPNDIDKIYVVNGPGSFTGVRIGVTVAKTFAWALKKKIIPISSLEVLASTACNTEYIVPLIDARRDAVYTGIYDSKLNVKMNDTYIEYNNLVTKLPDNFTFISDDRFIDKDVKESSIDILKVINKHKDDEGLPPHELNPNYLKITEAEAKLNTND